MKIGRKNVTTTIDIAREALLNYRRQWQAWLELEHTTDAERQLAELKIALIDQELASGELADATELLKALGV